MPLRIKPFMFSYAGNIHIHTLYSDGSASVGEIAAAAASAGLSYVIITDHQTLAALPEEGYYGDVALLVGAELNRNCNHYLALGLLVLLPENETDPQEMIDQVRAQGALGFIAHPFEKGSPLIENGKAYPWTVWPVFDFTGLEIWNYTSHWRGRARTIARTLFWFLFNRRAAMDGPPAEALRLWDCYIQSGRRTVGIGGTDAHAFKKRLLGLIDVDIFPYRFLFKTINTYICLREPLSRDFAVAKRQIYGALGEGRCYISFDQLYPGKGFSYYCRCAGAPELLLMGEQLPYRRGLELQVKAPTSRSRIRIIHHGRLIAQADGAEMLFSPPSPGGYRVEVYYRPRLGRPRPWIISNPIYLT